MDYIKAMNNFLEIVEELPPNAIKLYLFLFKKANSKGCFKQGDAEYVIWLSLENIIGATGLNRKAIETAREALISAGAISYKQGSSHKRSEYTLNFHAPLYAPFHVQKEHENEHKKVQPNINVNVNKIKEKKERASEHKASLYVPLPYEPTLDRVKEIFLIKKSTEENAIKYFGNRTSKKWFGVNDEMTLIADITIWLEYGKSHSKQNFSNNYQQNTVSKIKII